MARWRRQPENSLNCCTLWRLGGVVDRVWKQADDPCRAIKIVALTGQLCATDQLTPDRHRTRYSKSALGAGRVPTRLSRMGLESAAPRKRNMIARGLLAWSPRPLKSPRSNIGLHRPLAGSPSIFGGGRFLPQTAIGGFPEEAGSSVATLTFLSVWPRVLRRNVRVKATLESYGC